jgi:hypothetical protein
MPIFFYGLFMDAILLKDKGFHPSFAVLAYVENFGLRIGERATLVKAQGERAYGVVMSLSAEEADALYGEASVADYVPERLVAITLDGTPTDVWSYKLLSEKLTGQNLRYVKSLTEVA